MYQCISLRVIIHEVLDNLADGASERGQGRF